MLDLWALLDSFIFSILLLGIMYLKLALYDLRRSDIRLLHTEYYRASLASTALAQSFQYCNMSLSHAERVDSLLALLSLDEKIGLIAPDPSLGSTCFAHIHGIPRVGLPEYGEIITWLTSNA